MLFTTFHPSEWYTAVDEHITPIRLTRPASLFFMVEGFSRTRVRPLLNTLIGYPNTNMSKQIDRNLECYVRHLRAEQFDGWFSTIEGRAHVEVALINDPTLFSAGPSHTLGSNNVNAIASNGGFKPQRLGTRYQFSPALSSLPPPRLTVHARYKPAIEQYMATCAQVAPNAFACEALFAASKIRYRAAPEPATPIRWKCDGLQIPVGWIPSVQADHQLTTNRPLEAKDGPPPTTLPNGENPATA